MQRVLPFIFMCGFDEIGGHRGLIYEVCSILFVASVVLKIPLVQENSVKLKDHIRKPYIKRHKPSSITNVS